MSARFQELRRRIELNDVQVSVYVALIRDGSIATEERKKLILLLEEKIDIEEEAIVAMREMGGAPGPRDKAIKACRVAIRAARSLIDELRKEIGAA